MAFREEKVTGGENESESRGQQVQEGDSPQGQYNVGPV